MQVCGKAFNDLGAPPGLILPLQDLAADLPVEQNQFTIDGERCPELGLPDALFQPAKEVFVTLGNDSCSRF